MTMTRRERLMATLRGEPVDRPPFSLYELDRLSFYPHDPDNPYDVQADPSWQPLLRLAREKADRIVHATSPVTNAPPDVLEDRIEVEDWEEGESRFVRRTLHAGDRDLTSLTRRDKDVDTWWTLEHYLEDEEDFEAYLDLPAPAFGGEVDPSVVHAMEEDLGDGGIVLLDTADPLCGVAGLFEMGDFTIMAMTRPDLMHRALERFASVLYPRTEAIAKALPGRLWRIYGPEYASPPYMPPRLFEEYVTRYVTPMVGTIQQYGGYARIHSHGNLRDVLDHIVATGCDGLDPIEPPPQGDVELAYVRERYGKQMVLFGNLEASDIENLPADAFREKVETALREGTAGEGRGFVLLPSASPYGRILSERALRNYEVIVECVERL